MWTLVKDGFEIMVLVSLYFSKWKAVSEESLKTALLGKNWLLKKFKKYERYVPAFENVRLCFLFTVATSGSRK